MTECNGMASFLGVGCFSLGSISGACFDLLRLSAYVSTLWRPESDSPRKAMQNYRTGRSCPYFQQKQKKRANKNAALLRRSWAFETQTKLKQTD